MASSWHGEGLAGPPAGQANAASLADQEPRCSARAENFPCAWYCVPTARHEVVEGHAIADTVSATLPGLGVGWIDQALPSQLWAKVNSMLVLLKKCPAALHAVAAGQETPAKKASAASDGAGEA